MSFNPDIHRRRSIRLPGYDYSRAGMYFITLCTWNREYLFGDIVDGEMRLNGMGEIILDCWNQIPAHCLHVATDAFVVMPNHVHGILAIGAGSGDAEEYRDTEKCRGTACRAPTAAEQFGKPVPGSIPTVVRSFKSATTKHANILQSIPGGKLWQRNYWERVIRDDAELGQTREYIAGNPACWDSDQLR